MSRIVYAHTRGLFWCLFPERCTATREINTKVTLESCWWRHNRLAITSQWPDNCDASTWQVISNSLDIDFIHSDIHGRSCKNWFLRHVIQSFENNCDGQKHSHTHTHKYIYICIYGSILRPHVIIFREHFLSWCLKLIHVNLEFLNQKSDINNRKSKAKLLW